MIINYAVVKGYTLKYKKNSIVVMKTTIKKL